MAPRSPPHPGRPQREGAAADARIAARHRAVFARDVVRASSPDGALQYEAAQIDGRELVEVVARGAHLDYDFGAGVVLRVRLGPRGRFVERAPEEPPAAGARLRLEGSRAIVELVAPAGCALVDAAAALTIP